MSQIPEKSEKSDSISTQNELSTDTQSAEPAEVNYAPASDFIGFDPEPKTVGCGVCKKVTSQLFADLQLQPAREPTAEIAMGIAQGRRVLSICMNCGNWKVSK